MTRVATTSPNTGSHPKFCFGTCGTGLNVPSWRDAIAGSRLAIPAADDDCAIKGALRAGQPRTKNSCLSTFNDWGIVTIYVIHHGYGTDGGFGDYSPPRWSAYPLEVDGRTVWFDNEPDAMEAVAKLNIASRDAFYNAGKGGSYTGDFPLEYEHRAINPVNGPVCDVPTAIALVTEVHDEAWAESQWGDIYCCDDGDCEDCIEGDR